MFVVSQNADERYFQLECAEQGLKLQGDPFRCSKVEAHYTNLRQYIFMNERLGATLNYKREVLRVSRPISFIIARWGGRIINSIGWIRSVSFELEKMVFSGDEFDSLLREIRPDLIVTGTPGYNVSDIHLLRSAKRAGVPSATVMLSWDNLTSKGAMGAVPDHLLVWSRLMAEESREYHDFREENVTICGSPQFDIYSERASNEAKAQWRAVNGIPSDAALIVYGTINPAILPHEHKLLKCVIESLRTLDLDRRLYVWVRVHPQAVRGEYSGSLSKFESLAASDVIIEKPPVQSEKLAWDLPRQDAEHLKMLLSCADVVALTSSTLAIDAACVGTPVIGVYFDGCDVPPQESVRRFLRYTHQQKLNSSGGMTIVHSPDELVHATRRYLECRNMHSNEREELVSQQLGTVDGRAGLRIGETLLGIASRQ